MGTRNRSNARSGVMSLANHHNRLGSALLLILLTSEPDAHSAPDNLVACGYHSVYLNMEQIPTSWWSHPLNESAMWVWNQYADLFRSFAGNGTWGKNGVNEFGGWPSDADLNSTWGFSWGSALALTVYTWNCECCQITESDVLFNPAYTWTNDLLAAEDNPSWVAYQPVLMHETGHVWGEQTKNESYSYNLPSVMHAYYSSIVQSGFSVHWPDSYLIRAQYTGAAALPSIKDMAVHSHFVNGVGHLSNSHCGSTLFTQGQSITAYGVSVENTGSVDLNDVRLRLYLSSNRTISTGDVLIGEWYWTSFPKVAYGVYDFTTTIPAGLSDGTWYVGAIITQNGYNPDNGIGGNDSTHLRVPIVVAHQCTDDVYEQNDVSSQAKTLAAPFGPTLLQACSGDDDWYKVWVDAPNGLKATITFSHAAGDVDMTLYDPDLSEIDSSTSVIDQEQVQINPSTVSGYYYLRVYGYIGAENSYQLTLEAIDNAAKPYGTGCPGSGGLVPALALSGAVTSGSNVTLSIGNALGGATAILVFGPKVSTPLPGGCSLLVLPSPVQLVLPLAGSGPGNGSLVLPAVVPPGVVPGMLSMQAFVLDPGGYAGYSATNGVEFKMF